VILGLSGLQVDVGVTHPTSLPPTGQQFGISGAYTTTFVGAFVEGLLEAGLQAPALQITLGEQGIEIGQTDQGVTGTATLPAIGSKTAQVTEPANTTDVNDGAGITWSPAPSPPFPAGLGLLHSTSGDFTAGMLGDGVYTGTTAELAGVSGSNAFPTGSQVVSFVDASDLLVSNPPATSGGGTDVVMVGAISVATPFSTSNTAFTTSGTNGSTADIGILPNPFNSVGTDGPTTYGIGIDGILNSAFYAGSPANAPCVLTGFTAGGAAAGPGIKVLAGPPIVGQIDYPTGPRFAPYASAYAPLGLSNLDSAGNGVDPGTLQAGDGVSIPLVTSPPTPTNQTVNMGIGGNTTLTLAAAQGSYPVGSFSLVGGSPQTQSAISTPPNRLTVTLTNPATGAVSLADTGATAATLTFQFNACDTSAPPVCSTSPGTVTVDIGTPPVVQPFSENVVGGQLVLSCDSPSNYVTPAATPPGPTLAPELQCPEFQCPSITLDGLEQTVTATTGNTGGLPVGSPAAGAHPGTIYISDNRGGATDSWTLTGTFIATPIGGANGDNPNAACAGIVAFCNSATGPGTAVNASGLTAPLNTNGVIAPKYLQVGSIGCLADSTGGSGTPPYNPPNLNPNATPTAGGAFGSLVTGVAAPVALCAAASGVSGGTFLYNATYSLTIPESVYAGNYFGSVQYTVG